MGNLRPARPIEEGDWLTAQLTPRNKITFSHDYKKVYVVSTGKGPGDTIDVHLTERLK